MGLVPGILFSLNKTEEHFLFSRKGKSMCAAHSSWCLLIPLDSISEPWGKKLILYWCTKGWRGEIEGPGDFISIKGGVQLHPREEERAPFTERSHLRKVLAAAEGPSNLRVEIPWDMRSEGLRRRGGTEVTPRVEGRFARALLLLAPVTAQQMGLRAPPCLEALELWVKGIINLSSSAWGCCSWWCLGSM